MRLYPPVSGLRHLLIVAGLIASLASARMMADEPQSAYDPAYDPTAAEIMADALVVRPLMLGVTAIGVGTFLVSLPFSLLGGNVAEVGTTLVMEPARYTFTRPLGDLRKRDHYH